MDNFVYNMLMLTDSLKLVTLGALVLDLWGLLRYICTRNSTKGNTTSLLVEVVKEPAAMWLECSLLVIRSFCMFIFSVWGSEPEAYYSTMMLLVFCFGIFWYPPLLIVIGVYKRWLIKQVKAVKEQADAVLKRLLVGFAILLWYFVDILIVLGVAMDIVCGYRFMESMWG